MIFELCTFGYGCLFIRVFNFKISKLFYRCFHSLSRSLHHVCVPELAFTWNHLNDAKTFTNEIAQAQHTYSIRTAWLEIPFCMQCTEQLLSRRAEEFLWASFVYVCVLTPICCLIKTKDYLFHRLNFIPKSIPSIHFAPLVLSLILLRLLHCCFFSLSFFTLLGQRRGQFARIRTISYLYCNIINPVMQSFHNLTYLLFVSSIHSNSLTPQRRISCVLACNMPQCSRLTCTHTYGKWKKIRQWKNESNFQPSNSAFNIHWAN